MFVYKFRIIHSVNDYFHIILKLMDFNDACSEPVDSFFSAVYA